VDRHVYGLDALLVKPAAEQLLDLVAEFNHSHHRGQELAVVLVRTLLEVVEVPVVPWKHPHLVQVLQLRQAFPLNRVLKHLVVLL